MRPFHTTTNQGSREVVLCKRSIQEGKSYIRFVKGAKESIYNIFPTSLI
jgi:hypothetical protein